MLRLGFHKLIVPLVLDQCFLVLNQRERLTYCRGLKKIRMGHAGSRGQRASSIAFSSQLPRTFLHMPSVRP